jgi:hypothetical protein
MNKDKMKPGVSLKKASETISNGHLPPIEESHHTSKGQLPSLGNPY